MPIHLSLDIEFYARDSRHWGGAVDAAGHQFRLRGLFLELVTQVRVRYARRSRTPSRWVAGFGLFGADEGPWPLARFRPASGVDVVDLLRLAELSRVHHRNLFGSVGGPNSARFIPRGHERELRDIAARLAGNERE